DLEELKQDVSKRVGAVQAAHKQKGEVEEMSGSKDEELEIVIYCLEVVLHGHWTRVLGAR
ncbi:hypothetical protein GGH97_006296, partial [Coemansia sp. RSA 475]